MWWWICDLAARCWWSEWGAMTHEVCGGVVVVISLLGYRRDLSRTATTMVVVVRDRSHQASHATCNPPVLMSKARVASFTLVVAIITSACWFLIRCLTRTSKIIFKEVASWRRPRANWLVTRAGLRSKLLSCPIGVLAPGFWGDYVILKVHAPCSECCNQEQEAHQHYHRHVGLRWQVADIGNDRPMLSTAYRYTNVTANQIILIHNNNYNKVAYAMHFAIFNESIIIITTNRICIRSQSKVSTIKQSLRP
jgi:hypothetical protein